MDKMQEFWYCVASQEELPLYKGNEINSDVCENLISLIDHYKVRLSTGISLENFLSEELLNRPHIINDLRLLLGISDKRLYLDLTFIFNRAVLPSGKRLANEPRHNLIKHTTSFFINQLKNSENKAFFSKVVSDYFIEKGIDSIINIFSAMDKSQITIIFNNLIAPKEIQQKQAKYRGHSAEMAFSKVFYECGVSIFPNKKHINPMGGYDPNVDLKKMSIVSKDTSNRNIHSFDLVIKDDEGNIRILVQSLIHSSDPGQYGVNKSDETIEIKRLINEYNIKNEDKPVYLMGSVDGVGFSENPNGTIARMINVFDDFFQMNTLFKIGLFLQKLGFINNIKGIKFDTGYFDDSAIVYFNDTYLMPANVENLTYDEKDYSNYLVAGNAKLIFK
ncbi:hypothetical protein GIY11_11660 [Aerococcaceae bacterium DSM 109653]|uniref:Uncharacterized protein n=1 Tax=Fundicoccus ignavus TaxID=2664442 RepID=A0A844C1S3_9LACT|nr:hypothetical protein [Fundicoccus ignavus]MRI82667.1 hypothetical protein [Fundicoccus ignavus]